MGLLAAADHSDDDKLSLKVKSFDNGRQCLKTSSPSTRRKTQMLNIHIKQAKLKMFVFLKSYW